VFWIAFSRTGIGAVVTLPGWQSLNQDFFAGTVLPSIADDRMLRRLKLKASGTFLHLDSAQPHLTSYRYDKCGVNKLPHPPNSPDLTPCDFLLFEHLKHRLDGRFFDDDIAVEGVVSAILSSIEPDMFVGLFAEWKHRLQQCVDQGGNYP
jgi:histone-lysine N-methyltransferase SETMAR